MRYHYEKPEVYSCQYGKAYECDHVVYDKCTLYKIQDRGLAVIQQRYDPDTKRTWWGEIDPWLTDMLYLHSGFIYYFDKMAGLEDSHKCYPTVSIRQIMWALKLKPLKKEPWETVFDRKVI